MGIKIDNISHSLGSEIKLISDFVPHNKVANIIKITGIKKIYRIAKKEDLITLCYKACKKIISKKNNHHIDGLILLTQSPKYNIPSNSFVLHKMLNLKKECMVFDINLGCSGYVYALSLANAFFKSKQLKKILIITGDTYSKYCKKLNVKIIFSDCATATIVSASNNKKIGFQFYSDGAKSEYLKQRSSNYQKNINENSLEMDGVNVFNFSLEHVPMQIKKLIAINKINIKKIDYLLLHQASKIVNSNIERKINIDSKKILRNYSRFGNTVSSSIPLLISQFKKKLKKKNYYYVALASAFQWEFATLKHKLYIITGAGSGLGKYCADYFSKKNKVLAIYNSSVIKNKKNLKGKKINLEKKTDIDNFFLKNKKIINDSKSITFLSFATYKEDSILLNITEKNLKKTFNINVFANFYFCSNLIPFMLNKKKSNIIFISSTLGLLGDKGISLYSSSKHALTGLMKSITTEFSKFNIYCNILSLGFFKSPLWYKLDVRTREKILKFSPSKKLGKKEDLLNAIIFLEKNSYMNGRYLNLDGGYGLV